MNENIFKYIHSAPFSALEFEKTNRRGGSGHLLFKPGRNEFAMCAEKSFLRQIGYVQNQLE